MATFNEGNRTGADILRGLLGLDSGASMLTRGNEALAKGANAAVEPIRQLANLLGTASVAPAQDIRQPNVIESMRLDAAKKALKKKTTMEAEEALQSPQGEEALADFIQKNEPQENSQTGMSPLPQSDETQKIQEGQDVLKQLMDFMSQPSSVENGTYKPMSILGGLISEHPDNILKKQQAMALTPGGAGAIERAKAEATLPTDIMKERVKNMSKLNEEGMLKPKDLFEGFRKDSSEFIKVRDAQNRVEASAQDPSAAGDLALIFNYMKVLDPGSTVREGEFANAENSGAAWQTVGRLYNKVMSGKRLTSSQRKDFIDRSRKLFKGMENQQIKNVNEYKRLAKENGIDFKRIILDTGIAQQNESQATTPGVMAVTSSGTKYRRVQ